MSVAEELGEFETEQEAQKICDELNDEAESCDYCNCVCMGSKRCINCGGKCTCNEKGEE
jgi:hypothetical protein